MAAKIKDDIFSSLPVELTTEIFSYLPPREILSAVNASLCLAKNFPEVRDRILLPHVQNFYLRFGQIDAVPLIEFLSELRSIREQHTAIADIEKHVEPVLDAMIALKVFEEPGRWRLTLPTLAKAEVLIPEMREMFIHHRLWKAAQTQSEAENQWLAFDEIPSWLVWSFAKSYMVFECHCCLFYHPDNKIMKSRMVGEDVVFLGDNLYGDRGLDGSIFEEFCPWECLRNKHNDIKREVILRLSIHQDPLRNHGIFKLDYYNRWEEIVTGQGYHYYLYLEGLVKNDGDLERYVFDVDRLCRLITFKELSTKERLSKLEKMAKDEEWWTSLL
ncbi:hypothetical protein FSST1_004689 [Fusarium sambucinum]